MSKYILPPGVVKACAGIVEGASDLLPYASYIMRAEKAIGKTYSSEPEAQHERTRLIEAIKLNLVNRREYNYDMLVRRYSLPVSLSMFKREKYKFCYELARQCGLVK